MYSELTNILLACSEPDFQRRSKAETALKNLENSNFHKFVLLLCEEMANPQKPSQSVMMAGITLKNSIDAKNPGMKRNLQLRWFSISEADRLKIRESLIKVFTSRGGTVQDIACLVIAKMASVELTIAQSWTDLPQMLMQLATVPQQNVSVCLGCLKTLGLLCEEAPDHMMKFATNLLDVCCKIYSQNDKVLMTAALKTILDCIQFGEEVFENEESRNVIMNILLNSINDNTQLSLIALDALAIVAQTFYLHLTNFIPGILRVTAALMQSPNPPVQLRAIEFWAVLAEIEADLLNYPDSASQNFICRSLAALIPALIQTMTQHDRAAPDDDDEPLESKAANAAGGCLALVALCAGDSVLPQLAPFIKGNICSPDWPKQEGAISALGIVMEGPSRKELWPLLTSTYDALLRSLDSPNAFVCDATSWAFARACSIFGAELLRSRRDSLLPALKALLKAPRTRVAANACAAASGLAEAADAAGKPTSPLSADFKEIAESLMALADRAHDGQNLAAAAFEALNSLIAHSANDSQVSVAQIARIFSNVLENSMQQPPSRDVASANNLRASLVGVLATVVKVLPATTIEKEAESLLAQLCAVLRAEDKTVFEEVLMAAAVLINKIGAKFAPLASRLLPFLALGLGGSLGAAVCKASAGVAGDLFRAVGAQSLNQRGADQLVERALELLRSPDVERGMKPELALVFGDLALSDAENFVRYVPAVLPVLCELAGAKNESEDAAESEFVNALRANLFEAFGMILIGLRESRHLADVCERLGPVLKMVELVASDAMRENATLAAALNFVGDVGDVMGDSARQIVEHGAVERLRAIAKDVRDENVKKALVWSKNRMVSISSF